MIRQGEAEQKLVATAVAIVPDKLTSDQLPQAREVIERAMHVLDLQLAQIRQDVGEEDPSDNARWWAKATAAQRIKGKQRQRLQTIMGDVNRRIRAHRREQDAQRTVSRERRFIQLARAHLSDETYLEIWRIVNDEFDDNS